MIPSHEYGYYIIHKTINYILIPTRFYVEGIKYSYVDMTMNNGKGKVTIKNKIIHEDTLYVLHFYLPFIIQMEKRLVADTNGRIRQYLLQSAN